jgi:MFS family permease
VAFNSAAFAGMLVAGVVADRWAQRTSRARALVPAIVLCASAPCLLFSGLLAGVATAVAAVVVAGMAQGSLDANLMPTLCTVSNPASRATGYGLLNLASTLAGGVMTYVGGRLKDADVPLRTTFQASAGFIILAGLLLFAVKPAVGPLTTPRGKLP